MGCQSSPGPPYAVPSLFEIGILIRGFGLGLMVSSGFLGAKAGFVGFGLRVLVSSGFLCAKAGHSDRAVRRVEESFSALEKQGKLYFLKVVKYKGEGKPTLSMRWFPLSLRPSPLPFTDQGTPLDPRTPCLPYLKSAF